jgi:transposase
MNYPPSAWERIMRIQDVFTKGYHQSLTWKEVAEILRVDARTVRRWKETIDQEGYAGLLDRRRQRPSPRRAPQKNREAVRKLYQTRYWQWNVKHFHEHLVRFHRLAYGYTWTKQVLQEAGLVVSHSQGSAHRKRRPRKPLVGMMLHIDGSDHPWIPALAPQRQDLIVVMDDADSNVYYAQLVPEEDTRSCLAALQHVVRRKGVFCSLYSDRASHFFQTPEAGKAVDSTRLTQVGRALDTLGIERIPAYSPQARGRSERLFRTFQDRLPKELALHGMGSVPEANHYLQRRFLPWYRAHWVRPPEETGSAFVPYRSKDLNYIFSIQESRGVNRDNTVEWKRRILQIEPSALRVSFAKCKVWVHEHLDGTISVVYGPHLIGRFDSEGRPLKKRLCRRTLQKTQRLQKAC